MNLGRPDWVLSLATPYLSISLFQISSAFPFLNCTPNWTYLRQSRVAVLNCTAPLGLTVLQQHAGGGV